MAGGYPDWQPVETAPAETTLIVWGGGGLRFMRKDALGQWRNMHHAPRPAPRVWMLPPPKPEAV